MNDGRPNPGILENHKVPGVPFRDTCGKCGATRIDRQIGLETTPDEYLATMVAVFREVKRVMRNDAVAFINMGDGYQDKQLLMMPARLALALQADGWLLRSAICWQKPNPMPESCTDRPTSSYEMVYLLAKCEWSGPERGMFADISDDDARWIAMFLDTEGSIVCKRSEADSGAIWYGAQISFANSSRELVERAQSIIGKGSVIARPPKPNRLDMFYLQLSNRQASDLLRRVYPHLLVKQRQAALAIHLQSVLADADKHRRTKEGRLRGRGRGDEYSALLDRIWQTMKALNKRHIVDTAWVPAVKQGRWVPNRYFYDADAVREPQTEGTLERFGKNPMRSLGGPKLSKPGIGIKNNSSVNEAIRSGIVEGGRNIRNVWTIPTAPYSEAHFATFPPELAERCIKAGTSERGCCAQCGKPWQRVTQSSLYSSTYGDSRRADVPGSNDVKGNADQYGTRAFAERMRKETTTTGWVASCQCKELRCVTCFAVLDSRRENRKTRTAHRVSDVRRGVQAMEARERVLQPSLLRTAGEEAEADGVPSVREDIHAAELPAEAVFRVVRSEMDSAKPFNDEGLDDHQQGLQADYEAGPSERDALWLRDGTSVGDGEEAGQASDLGRGGPPQERRQAGQPDQQPGTDGKASARRASKADLSCDVPTLSHGVSDARKCPHCGSDTEWSTPATSPCVVLDCFAGAGTTLLVADRLQRHAIGIELNPAYTEMAMARLRADAPLLSTAESSALSEDFTLLQSELPL